MNIYGKVLFKDTSGEDNKLSELKVLVKVLKNFP